MLVYARRVACAHITYCAQIVYNCMFSANSGVTINHFSIRKQGRKRPLDTPKRMIERRERERKG